MIYELLDTGRRNARTGRQLAKILHCDIRDITEQIERERREGRPICASTGENPGYYLAESAEELDKYCSRLKSRAIEIFKTRQALIRTLREIAGTRQEGITDGKGKGVQ